MNFYREIRRVFPSEIRPVELEMDHTVFSCVFPLKMTEPARCRISHGRGSQYTHVTWERQDAEVISKASSTTRADDGHHLPQHHNGDGWEREGEYQYYFREFSEKKAYPLMINILFYAMTH